MADRRQKLVLEPGRLLRLVAGRAQVFGESAGALFVLLGDPAGFFGAGEGDPLLLVASSAR